VRRGNHDQFILHILSATSSDEALALLALHPVGVILTDQRMEATTGIEFLARARKMHPKAVRMVLSGYTGLDSLTEAINRGEIYKFFTKPGTMPICLTPCVRRFAITLN
jgi:response regulator RpfG family c-di-GMP phosphodiesterase